MKQFNGKNLDLKALHRAYSDLEDDVDYDDSDFINCAIFTEKGTREHFIGKPCHGFLRETYAHENDLLITHPYKMDEQFLEEELEPFFDWLFNESMHKDVFLNENIQDVYNYGFVTHFKVTANHLLPALQTARFVVEEALYGHFNTWVELVNKGMDKNHAYLTTAFMRQYVDGFYLSMEEYIDDAPFCAHFFTQDMVSTFLNKQFPEYKNDDLEFFRLGYWQNVAKGWEKEGRKLCFVISDLLKGVRQERIIRQENKDEAISILSEYFSSK